MDRVRTVQHKGRDILIVDYGGLTPTEYKPVMHQAIAHMQALPPRSVLLVTHVAGTRFGVGTTEDVKYYSDQIKPHLRGSAVVGLSGLQGMIFTAAKPFLSKGIRAFPTLAEAMDWLVGLPGGAP